MEITGRKKRVSGNCKPKSHSRAKRKKWAGLRKNFAFIGDGGQL